MLYYDGMYVCMHLGGHWIEAILLADYGTLQRRILIHRSICLMMPCMHGGSALKFFNIRVGEKEARFLTPSYIRYLLYLNDLR